MKRTTINDVEKRRGATKAAIQKMLRDTVAEQRRKDAEAATEAAEAIVESYRENHSAPNPNASQGHTAALGADTRLGSAYRKTGSQQAPPVVPMTGNDLGSAPEDPSYTGPAPHRSKGIRRSGRDAGGNNG